MSQIVHDTRINPFDAVSARRSELVAMLAESDDAYSIGRLDALDGKRCDPCDWELGLTLSEQSDRMHEYLRGYEAEQKRECV